MTTWRNDTNGTRGVMLSGGGYVFIAPGKTGSAPSNRVHRVPNGLIEIDPDAEGELEAAPDDLGTFDHDGDGKAGGSKPGDLPALSSMTRDELEAQAELEGVDVSAIEGSGASGNVIVDDIRAAIEAKRAAPAE